MQKNRQRLKQLADTDHRQLADNRPNSADTYYWQIVRLLADTDYYYGLFGTPLQGYSADMTLRCSTKSSS